MNTKTQYLLPVFVAVFALMFVAATPYVVAEPEQDNTGDDKSKWKDASMHHKKHKAIEVEGFVGTIAVPETMDKDAHKALKEQITVSLSEAAQDLDVMKGKIGIAVNENGQKFVVWKLVSKSMNDESSTIIKTIHVIDAGDASNSVAITKQYDPSMKSRDHVKTDKKLSDPQKIETKIQKIEKKLNEGIENKDLEQSKVEYVFLLRQLQTAINDGNELQADSLREQLKELRNQMIDLKKFK